MLRIPKEKAIFSMADSNKPVLTVMPGARVCFETFDCFENQFDSPDTNYDGIDWDRVNPATGPVYVKGAMPGDILAVQIEKVKLDNKGIIFSGPNIIFKERINTNALKRVKISGNNVLFNDEIKVPLKPMIGVIGTAPRNNSILNGLPGEHGGNMDCKEIKEGTTLFLPVNVPGALLALGDLHAAMGDGEVTSGVEVAGEVTVGLELIKTVDWRVPLAITDEYIISIASSEMIEEAINKAVNNMAEWLVKELNMNFIDASMLLSITSDVKMCQVVNPLKTVRIQIPFNIIEQYGYIPLKKYTQEFK